MPQDRTRPHPDPERLDLYRDGRLSDSDTAEMKRHIEECVLCRLELKRMARFEAIDADADLAGEAGWSEARERLERRFEREIVLPAATRAGPAPEPRATEKRPPRPFLRWLIPAAATAAAVLLIWAVDRSGGPESTRTGSESLRGGAAQMRLRAQGVQ